MKKAIQPGLLLSATLLLAACGGTTSPAASSPVAAPSSAAAKPAASAPASTPAPAKPAASGASSGAASAKPAASGASAPAKPAPSGAAPASGSAAAKPATSGGAGEKVNVAITSGSVTGAGIYIALNRGYFKDVGLDVTITPFPGGAQMISSLASSQVDVADTDPGAGLLNAVSRDLPMRFVADGSRCDKDHCGTAFTVRKDLVDSGKFKDLKDLKGLTINTFISGSTLYQFLYRMLDQAGLKESDVKLQKVEAFADVLPAMTNKALDASWMIEPLTTTGVEKGILSRYKTATDLFGGWQNTMIVYSPNFATQRTETGKKFMAGYIKGLRDWIDAVDKNKDYDEIIQIMTKESSLKDPALYKKIGLPGFDPNGALALDILKSNQQWYVDHGDVKNPIDIDKVYDPQFLQYAISADGKR
jgi:NitT/TauT family transport system substrate-binding protein